MNSPPPSTTQQAGRRRLTATRPTPGTPSPSPALTRPSVGPLLAAAAISLLAFASLQLTGPEVLAWTVLALGIAATTGGVAQWFRVWHRREVVSTAAEALYRFGLRTPDATSIKATRWSDSWIGYPTRLTLYLTPDIDTASLAWQQEVLPLVRRRFDADYRVAKLDTRRCRLHLRHRPPSTEPEPDALHTRASTVATILLGPGTRVTPASDDSGALTAVEATFEASTKLASPRYQAGVTAVFSAMLPGRWRAHWDVENDKVRFELRPVLPRRIPRPPIPSTPDLDRIPIAVGEDGQDISWQLNGMAPHFMLCGKTGSGKTTGIIGVVLEATARGWPVWACDPKRIEFLGLRTWPNVQIVATTTEDQVATIYAAWREMEARYEAIEAGDADESDFEPLILVLDEYRDLVGAVTNEFYPRVKRPGMPSKCPVFEKVSSIARKGRSARIHLVLGTQRPDAEFLGGEMRDNFATRMSFGRLSPQGAQMMWESTAGVSVPNGIRGRGTGVTIDDVPVEAQCYYTPDPRKAKDPEDLALLEQLRPATISHPHLRVRPLQHLLDDEDSQGREWEAYTNAELVPIRAEDLIHLAAETPADPSPETTPPYDDYGPPEERRASDLAAGDLAYIEDVGDWAVIETIEADLIDEGMTCIDWRTDEDEAGSLSVPSDIDLSTRRPLDMATTGA